MLVEQYAQLLSLAAHRKNPCAAMLSKLMVLRSKTKAQQIFFLLLRRRHQYAFKIFDLVAFKFFDFKKQEG